MARTNTRLKQQAEKRFPHKFDVPVPPGGIGKRLNAMLAWCGEHAARGMASLHWQLEISEQVVVLFAIRLTSLTREQSPA